MKNKKKEIPKNTRRNFINKGLHMSAGLLAGVEAILPDSNEKVKMLTPDGKLVEVDRRYIRSSKKNIKNKDIIDWVDNPGINKPSNLNSDKKQ